MCNAIETGSLKTQVENYEENDNNDHDEVNYITSSCTNKVN